MGCFGLISISFQVTPGLKRYVLRRQYPMGCFGLISISFQVTPGLKRYVLRRQYPMETLEELEKKVSYIERVQGHRW